jgi:hypothetical protein
MFCFQRMRRERVMIFRARTLLYFCSILFIASVRFTDVAAQNPAESRVNAAERRKIETAFISSLETSDSTESAIAVSVNPIQGSSSIDLVRRALASNAQLTDIKLVEGLAQISREGARRRIGVELNVRGRDIGSFVKDAQAAIDQQVKLPPGYYLTWGGTFENLRRASARLLIVVPLALFLIFVLLFTTFGSVRQALLIYTGIPFSVVGGVLALALRGMPV